MALIFGGLFFGLLQLSFPTLRKGWVLDWNWAWSESGRCISVRTPMKIELQRKGENCRLILPNIDAVKTHRKLAVLCVMYSYHLWRDKALYRSQLLLELLLVLWDLPNKYYPDADVPSVSGQAFINSPHTVSHWLLFFGCENFR